MREIRKDIGMIFQSFSLIERKTVYENIALPIKLWKYDSKQINEKVMYLFQLIDLRDKINSYGCGHNWVGVHAIGWDVVLSKLTEEFQETIAVIGSPPEEYFGDRTKILESDYFKEFDAVYSSHLNNKNLLQSYPRPINSVEFKYVGKASQAFAWPDKGVNAVDTLVDTINKIRLYMKTASKNERINYILKDSGKNPGSIPDESTLRLTIGSNRKFETDKMTNKII